MSEKRTYNKQEKEDIFKQEFMPHADALYNFAYKLTFSEENAKDLVQDTYMKAFRFMNGFERGTNAKAWLFRILKNTFINNYRKQSKEPAKVDYQNVENYYNSQTVHADITQDLRSESVKHLIGDEITLAVNALSEEFRTVIILCDLEGFTYEEMAAILDIPIGTVRSRLHRARNILKEKLMEYAKKQGFGKE